MADNILRLECTHAFAALDRERVRECRRWRAS
jgi:hypothetical protein